MKRRLEWAGLSEFNEKISLITHAELFSTAKPKKSYYSEILTFTNKNAVNCLMVGNDLYNDGAASLLGMQFYHVLESTIESKPDFLSERTKDSIDYDKIKVTDSGSLEKLYNIIRNYVE